jgi:hypothetical protein
MKRVSSVMPAIVVSALFTGLAVPFACAGSDSSFFDEDFGSGDEDVSPPAGTDNNNEAGCVGADCPLQNVDSFDCGPLLQRTCGECADSPACEAATLVARYEPQRCSEAMSDERRFPGCTARACDELMRRVCGGPTPTEACASNPGCGPAEVLFKRSQVSESTAKVEQAEASCASALTDDVVFAPCGG